MHSILIVEDDMNINGLLKEALEKADYLCTQAFSGTEARMLLAMNRYSVVLLDLMLPKMDGLEVCQQIREFSNVPIVMLTAKGEDMDKILGLEYGADDYMTKPFSVLELCARVRALLRRGGAAPAPKKGGVLKSGGLKLDLAVREATRDGALLELTYKEFELLRELMENAPGAMSRDELLQSVWGYDFIGETRTLDMHIGTLRHKLGDESTAPRYIKTVRGVGYRFLGEVEKEG